MSGVTVGLLMFVCMAAGGLVGFCGGAALGQSIKDPDFEPGAE